LGNCLDSGVPVALADGAGWLYPLAGMVPAVVAAGGASAGALRGPQSRLKLELIGYGKPQNQRPFKAKQRLIPAE